MEMKYNDLPEVRQWVIDPDRNHCNGKAAYVKSFHQIPQMCSTNYGKSRRACS